MIYKFRFETDGELTFYYFKGLIIFNIPVMITITESIGDCCQYKRLQFPWPSKNHKLKKKNGI